MRQLLILIFLTTSVFSYSQSQSEEPKMNEPVNWVSLSMENYQINHPSNWEVDKSGQLGTSFFLFSPVSDESDNFKENVNLLIQDLTGHDLNLDQYAKLSEDQIKTLINEGKIIESERITSGEKEYHKMVYTGKQGVFQLKFEQFYWVIDNRAYVLTLTCEAEEFENYADVGERILKSFRIN